MTKQGTKRWTMLLAALLLAAPACNPTDIDAGDAADVVLEIVTLDNPPVTGTQGGTAGCEIEVASWTATIAAQPKNSLAGGDSIPFNDIVMESVLISYEWVNCATCVTTDRLVGLGNTTIPAGGSNSVTFEPIAFDDITDLGVTGNLTLLFTGRTVEGTRITQTALRQLFIETCSGN